MVYGNVIVTARMKVYFYSQSISTKMFFTSSLLWRGEQCFVTHRLPHGWKCFYIISSLCIYGIEGGRDGKKSNVN